MSMSSNLGKGWHRRLIRNIRTADDVSSMGAFQRECDICLEDRDDLGEASGIGKSKRT